MNYAEGLQFSAFNYWLLGNTNTETTSSKDLFQAQTYQAQAQTYQALEDYHILTKDGKKLKALAGATRH